jgi:pyridoxal phosphate enzyme (YggS family)
MNFYDTLNQVEQLIAKTERDSGRNPNSVLLLAVSKQQSTQAIEELFSLGIRHFGESYLQEAQPKINKLLHLPLYWHFIGPIQSNKTKGIASSFSWVHSISRFKIASQLDRYRPPNLEPLNVCLQIQLVPEQSKSGIRPQNASELALAVNQLPHLKLRGLMTIPPPIRDPQKQFELFMQLNQLLHALNRELGLTMDTLSMGMSDDLVPAIKAGATIVRVGRALFG